MATLIYKSDDGDSVEIQREIGGTYPDLVNMFYSLSLGIGYSNKTVDDYLDCEYNDYAITNDCRKDDES